MTLLDMDQQVRDLQFATRQPVQSLLAGEYLSVFKGRGMEFEDVREYQPGDEVRSIDWNVTARTGHPHIKQFIEERELTLFLMVDVSPSFTQGPVGSNKRDQALRLLALIGGCAAHNQDRVGLILFTDTVETYIPPGKGDRHVRHLMHTCLTHEPDGQRTDVGNALTFLEQVTRKRSIVILVSDFQTPDFREPIQIVSRHHDVIALSILDRHETELPDIGLVCLKDNETGKRIILDTHQARTRALLRNSAEDLRKQQAATFESLHIDHLMCHTDDDPVGSLLNFFRERRQRGGHVAFG